MVLIFRRVNFLLAFDSPFATIEAVNVAEEERESLKLQNLLRDSALCVESSAAIQESS